MLSLFLATESTDTSSSSNWVSYVIMGVLIVAIVAMFIISSRRNKKQQKEQQDKINSVRPGNKVTTIGGISGIVVEVNEEEETFVLETGSEATGKSYMKFVKQAIYQTDAQSNPAVAVEDKKADAVFEGSEEAASQAAEEVTESAEKSDSTSDNTTNETK
jgi:preprotein translocase subunit YajC